MDIEIEFHGLEQTFKIPVVGVTFPNPNGSDRQQFIKQCRPGETIRLIREPDNPHDPLAVAVLRANDQQVGYLPRGDRLAYHLDRGGGARARVFRRTGGSTEALPKILEEEGESRDSVPQYYYIYMMGVACIEDQHPMANNLCLRRGEFFHNDLFVAYFDEGGDGLKPEDWK